MIYKLRHYFGLHRQNAIDAFDDLIQKPLASMLTIAVIGIALALPAALNLLVQNGRSVADSFDGIRDFSVYLKPSTSLADAGKLAESLRLRSSIKTVRIISADDALKDFQETSGYSEALSTLGTNPLPHTLVVRPTEAADAARLTTLAAELSSKNNVDQVRIDTDWVKRLSAILDLLRRSVAIAGVLLIAAVIIIVGNTIRLDIQSRRDEIEVLKLLGASDGFVRRPFLYVGVWYGLVGGLFGIVLLVISALILAEPIERLTGLYQANFALQGLNFTSIGAILLGGFLSGWIGAWTAVSRHIASIQPE
ncbi:MAG: permease-like cell division protein FtsX [Gammaproteobacteria bacterium]|nr:permease-like cell division protein FtsX [Gammaproteobacteria bacterium]